MLTASGPSSRFLCHVLVSLGGGGLAHCAVGRGSLPAAVAWQSRAGSTCGAWGALSPQKAACAVALPEPREP